MTTRVFTGFKPTGQLQVGNYLGAIRPLLDLASDPDNDVLVCVVDLHALTVEHGPAQLRELSLETAGTLVACGLDPRAKLFVQSTVPAHTELSYLLESTATYGEMSRMVQFKEKAGGQDSTRLSLLTYPALMAADILAYQAEVVPVGDDQRQHLELTRDLATRFNSRYGRTFTVPEGFIPPAAARVLDLQSPDKKMSKSLPPAGCINLLDDPKVNAKKVRSAVTDTGREVVADPVAKPGVTNLLTIHSALSGQSIAALEERFAGRGYGDLKKEVAEVVTDALAPIQQRTAELLGDPAELQRILATGAARAREVAAPTLATVYDRVGFLPPAAP